MTDARSSFLTVEWLAEAEEQPLAQAPMRPSAARVSRLVECQSCGWMESETAEACFRCGQPVFLDAANDPTLRRLGIAMEGAIVHISGAGKLHDEPSDGLDARGYLLRVEAERLSLVRGFDDLLSLEQVDLRQYDYQINACRTALSDMRGHALLADEVGLGKTIEAGLIMKELLVRRMIGRVLVLTPASLIYQWREELETKFHERFELVSSAAQWDEFATAPNARVILSLDRAKGDLHAPRILERPWDLLVIDEAHRLKNRSTRAYKFVKQIERRYILMLTATPVHNDLTELYSLVDLLKPGQLGTIRAFKEQFVKTGDPRSPENAPALQQLLRDVMIRNRRTEVGIDFPKRRAAVLHLDLPEDERALYDGVTSFIRSSLNDPELTGAKRNRLRLGLLTLQRELCSSPAAVADTLRHMASDANLEAVHRDRMLGFAAQADAIGYAAKVDALLELLEEYEGKFLVFTEFRRSQDELFKALEESGISATKFHGGLTGAEKELAIAAFRDETRVLVSTESGGEGRNLQFCHQLINYDLPWNPMRVEQRIGRIHRLGQTRDVSVFNLSTRDTLEAYLLDLLARKIRMFELVVGELELILGDAATGEVQSFEELVTQAWLQSEDDIELSVAVDEIGQRFAQSRGRYLDTRLLNEQVFTLLDAFGAEGPTS